jgi:D-ribose pyranose/furanose isomerase RbsD
MRYFSVPCIILDSNTDLSIIQGIVVSMNLNYRKMPKDIQIKAVLALDEALSKNKKYKNQINITNIISNKIGISRTNTKTLRGFKNLSENALELLYEDHLSRESARILSMINDKDTQDMLIDRLGRQINNVSLLKEMISKPSKKETDFDIKVASTDTMRNKLELDRKIKKAEEMFPETTTITLKVKHTELEQFLRDLNYIRAGIARKHQTIKNGEINKYLNITLNDVHMDQYLRNGFVTQETINLINSSDYNKITALA